MRPSFKSLIKRLDLGHYAIQIDHEGRAASIPISSRERSQFERIGGMYAGCGQHPRAPEPGVYLVRVDQHHTATDIVGVNRTEARAFLTEIMGANRCYADATVAGIGSIPRQQKRMYWTIPTENAMYAPCADSGTIRSCWMKW